MIRKSLGHKSVVLLVLLLSIHEHASMLSLIMPCNFPQYKYAYFVVIVQFAS